MYKIQLQTKYLKCIKRQNNLQRIFPKTIQQIVLINNTTLNTANTAGQETKEREADGAARVKSNPNSASVEANVEVKLIYNT